MPNFVNEEGCPYAILPPGEHLYNLNGFKKQFAFNELRLNQYNGLVRALVLLKQAGCRYVYIDGSYVSNKELPGDWDGCYDIRGTVFKRLGVFVDKTDLMNGRKIQKELFLGEMFPSSYIADSQLAFLDFFQIEKYSKIRKGIVKLDLFVEDLS